MIEFCSNPPLFTLHDKKVDVWFINLSDDSRASALDWTLNVEEQRRFARYRFDKDKQQFARSHNAMRFLLSRYLGTSPAQLQFLTELKGKPYLKGLPLSFNLSHSAEMAVLGITKHNAIGVDIERYSQRDFLGLARHSFSDDEYQRISNCHESNRRASFFQIWSQKEAFIKTSGSGLSYPLKTFSVNHRPPGGLTQLADGDIHHWTLSSADYLLSYAVAICVKATNVCINYFDFNLLSDGCNE